MTEGNDLELSEDILKGAAAISDFLFGDAGARSRVYYLAKHTKLPVFRIGAVLCARRSVLLNYISKQENRFAAH